MIIKYNQKVLINKDFILFVFLLIPAIDVLLGYSSLQLGLYSGSNMGAKMITLLPGILIRGILFLLLFNEIKRYNQTYIIYLFILISVFLLTELSYFYYTQNLGFLIYGITYFYKLIFILTVLFFFLSTKNSEILKNLDLIVLNTVIWYTLAILIGYAIGMDYKTYGGLGSSGFLIKGSANSASLAFLIASPFILTKLFYSKNTRQNILLWFLYGSMIIASFILLTKVSVLSLLVMFFIFMYYKLNKTHILNKLLLILLLIIIITIAVIYLADSNFINRLIFVYNYMDGNILKILLSGRDEFLLHGLNMYLNDFNAFQYLFGAGANHVRELMEFYTNVEQGIELDFADIIAKYGIIGFLLYYLFFIYFCFKAIKNLIVSTSIELKIFSFAYIMMFIIANMAGHVFTSGLMGFLIPLLIIKLTKKGNINYENTTNF